MKKEILTSIILCVFVIGCGDNTSEKITHSKSKEEVVSNFESTNSSVNQPQKMKITIKQGSQIVSDDNKFVKYNIDGEKKIDFSLNGDVSDTTKQLVAQMSIKNQYEKLNLSLIKNRLSRNFIVHCSACHDDYANGVIGPSLLGKSGNEIAQMMKKYKLRQKPNALMVQLLDKMSDDEIQKIADEISEFNKQFGGRE